MKVLSLTQPWASLVALEEKRIETRSWRTSYRGPIAIHASRGFPLDCRELGRREPFLSVLARYGLAANNLPLGAILCTTSIEDCVAAEKVLEAPCYYSEHVHEIAFGDYGPGRFGLILGSVTRTFVPPVPARGSLGLWEWAEPVEWPPVAEAIL